MSTALTESHVRGRTDQPLIEQTLGAFFNDMVERFPEREALVVVHQGRRYTYQWASLFVLFYLMEGLVRATSDHGLSQVLGMVETVLSAVLFACVVAYARITRPSKQKATGQ